VNTKEAYEAFKSGARVGVVVPNLVRGGPDIYELTAALWLHRLRVIPDAHNHVIIEDDNHGNES
jgi:hypothetical protein